MNVREQLEYLRAAVTLYEEARVLGPRDDRKMDLSPSELAREFSRFLTDHEKLIRVEMSL